MFILNSKIKNSVILKILFLFTILLFNKPSKASHMIGGYMSYEYINILPNGKLRYLVKYHVFRDCINGIDLSSNLKLAVYYNTGEKRLNFVKNVSLASKRIVNPPGNIECVFYRDRVCVEYGVYQTFIDLEESKTGYILLYQECCRNIQTNLINSDNQGQVYTTEIPNTELRNSSPQFSGVPSPFMCSLDTTDFSFNAYDKDGDVLSYKFVRPYRGNSSPANSIPDPESRFPDNIQEVQYSTGYSENFPFGINGYQNINKFNGMTSLFSPNIGSYVVAVEVTEKRGGLVISRIRMDLQILVYNCPDNKKPILSNLTNKGRKYYEITSGEKLCFDIESFDPDNHMVFLTADGEVFGKNSLNGTRALFNDTSGFGRVVSRFCWTPDCDHYRDEPYTVHFSSRDNGCPSKLSTFFIDIKVNEFRGAKDLSGPDISCQRDTSVYSLVYEKRESLSEWELSGGKIIKKDSHSITVVWDNPGFYTIRAREILQNGECRGTWIEKKIEILRNPDRPNIIGSDTVCIKSDITYSIDPSMNGINWLVSTNAVIKNINGDKIKINWSTHSDSSFIGVYEIDTNGCSSDTALIPVYISDPNPIIDGPLSVCPNSLNVEYKTNNNIGSLFDWFITGGDITNYLNKRSVFVNWGDSGVARLGVQERNRFGCLSPINEIIVNKTYSLPKLEIFGDSLICDIYTDHIYRVNMTNGSNYYWDIIGGQQTSGDSSSEISINWFNTGIFRIGVRQVAKDMVNNKFCLSPVSYLDVIINRKPTADIIEGLTSVCQFSDTNVYKIDGFDTSRYIWSIDGQILSNQEESEIKVFWDKPGVFNINAQEITEFGCIGDIIQASVIVHPKPKTSKIDGEFIICIEDALSKKYSVTGFNNSEYFWWTNGGYINSIDNSKSFVLIDWNIDKPSAEIKALEISEFGCPGDTQYANIEIDILEIDTRYVSVGTPDNHMEIYWKIPEFSDVKNFEIWKYSEMNNWSLLRVVNKETRSFFETNIDTDISPYSYKIVSKNKCGNTTETFIHTNVNLKLKETNNNKFTLKFNPYIGWKYGVYKYDLYEKGDYNSYQLVKSDVSPDSYINLERLEESFKQCYRILAYEYKGGGEISWSNEQCVFFSPLIYIPNAFTPNGDGNNDRFKPVVFNVYSYQLLIYNRWGELIFSTTDDKMEWDGDYKNSPSPQGTYIYSLIYRDYKGKEYKTRGTINLLR